jgi:hypothetical protein
MAMELHFKRQQQVYREREQQISSGDDETAEFGNRIEFLFHDFFLSLIDDRQVDLMCHTLSLDHSILLRYNLHESPLVLARNSKM